MMPPAPKPRPLLDGYEPTSLTAPTPADIEPMRAAWYERYAGPHGPPNRIIREGEQPAHRSRFRRLLLRLVGR
jgi:hypothetical protein